MQPIARTVSKLFSNSVTFSSASRTLRISNQPSFRPSICLQCKIRTQTRRFANSPKSTDPDSSNQKVIEKIEAVTSSQTTPAPEDVSHSDLPSAAEGRRTAVTKRFSHLMDHLQGNIFVASQRINDLTGYSGIEALKGKITELEDRVQEAQELVRSSRTAYKATVAERAATQREVTGLLARKDTWRPSDLERFTSLYRMDHSNEQAVQEAVTKLADAEREAENAASKLSSSILSRYHEEQIWSDKIRRMSTWGTWGLMGVNVLLFLVFQFGFEPWRRRRLVRGFEEKVREALEKEKLSHSEKHDAQLSKEVPLDGVIATGIQELAEEVDASKASSEPAIHAVVACIQREFEEETPLDAAETHKPFELPHLKDSKTWKTTAKKVKSEAEDLFSTRKISIPKKDVTIIALEGAATGAAIVAIIAALLRPAIGR